MTTWWPGTSQNVLRYVSLCKRCKGNRHRLGRKVSIWPDAEVWERLYMDRSYFNDHGNILVIVDEESGSIEVFPAANRTSQTMENVLESNLCKIWDTENFCIRQRSRVCKQWPKTVLWITGDWKGGVTYPSSKWLWWHTGTLPRREAELELLLRRNVRFPAVIDIDLCSPVLLRPFSRSQRVQATLIVRKGIDILFIQPENSNQTMLVSDK